MTSQQTARRKPVPCAWCGREVAPNPTGRARKYCAQACRQRAYEQRHKLEQVGLPEDAILLSPKHVSQLHDRLFALRCAAEDVSMALEDGEDPETLSQLVNEMLVLAKQVERFRDHVGDGD